MSSIINITNLHPSPLLLTVRCSSTLAPKKNNPPQSMLFSPSHLSDRAANIAISNHHLLQTDYTYTDEEEGFSSMGWYSSALSPESSDLSNSASQSQKQHTIQVAIPPKIVKSINRIGIQFQGGFVGLGGKVTIKYSAGGVGHTSIVGEDGGWGSFEDTNAMQYVNVKDEGGGGTDMFIESVTFTFDRGTDFYGRVIIYVLELWGSLTE